jgi:amino acid permease
MNCVTDTTITSEAMASAPKYGGVTTSAQGHPEDSETPTFTNNHRIDNADFVTDIETQGLRRGLSQRHISLIAIAGAIVGSGFATYS